MKSIFFEDEATDVVETEQPQVPCQVGRGLSDLPSPWPAAGVSCSSPGSSRVPLLCEGPASPGQDSRRLTRSYSCHQFDARGALLQFGAGLGACFPMEAGSNLSRPGRALPRFTDEEVFLASHPGADYTTAKRK